VVRESVAHSWVEVYFPGFGWQRFEPTPAPYASVPLRPARPPAEDEDDDTTAAGEDNLGTSSGEDILRRLEEERAQAGDGDPEAVLRELEALRARQRLEQLLTGLAVLGVLAALAGVAWLTLQWDLRGLTPAQAAFARLSRLAGWAGMPQEPHATPHEYGEQLKHRLRAGREPIDRIVETYVADRYAPPGSPPPDEPALRAALSELRTPLLRRLLARVGEAFRPREEPRPRRR
jgi:hypothetical protein